MPPFRTSVLITPVLLAILFGSTLSGSRRIAFRDSSHFYTPLYDYVAHRTQTEWLPLWNPLDQTGTPLAGETTTALFYPIRVVVFRFAPSADVALAWYVVLHLIIAAMTAYFCARCCGRSRTAATLVSVVYPLSGSVLFLYSNPPFLVGAAWLPLVLGVLLPSSGTDRDQGAAVKIRPIRYRWAAVALALMVLGGDPQTALHAMIVVAVVKVCCLARSGWRGVRTDLGRSLLVPLFVVPLAAALLAAPQLVASLSWSRQSDRLADVDVSSWLAPPRTDSRRAEAFQFSLPPWHIAELLTPNASGTLFPVHRRVSQLIPGDGRMWTPTLYLGMLAALALLARLIHFRRLGGDRWLWIAIAALFASLGHFGVAWLLQNAFGILSGFDSAVGGLYWWLYQFVPGYDAFRYPPKWLPVFSLAAAMVTAKWLDRPVKQLAAETRPLLIGLGLLSAVALMSVLLLRQFPDILWDANRPPQADPFWGPVDVRGGLSEIAKSLAHSITVLSAIAVVLRWASRAEQGDATTRVWLLAILAVDIAVCGWGLVATVERNDSPTFLSQRDEPNGRRWMRTQSGGGWPESWRTASDQERLRDVERSQQQVWFGRWHLMHRQAVLNNMVSIRSESMAKFWQAAQGVSSQMEVNEREEFWYSVRQWLGVGGVVHATNVSIPTPQDGRIGDLVDAHFRTEEVSRMRFHVRWRASRDRLTTGQFQGLLERVNRKRGEIIPTVESAGGDRAETMAGGARDSSGSKNASWKILKSSSDVQVIRVTTNRRGLLTRAQLQDGKWRAEISAPGREQWRPIEVLRVDELKQGVFVPEGDWQVRFYYDKRAIVGGMVIALATWLVIVLLTCLQWRRDQPAKRHVVPNQAATVSSPAPPAH